MYKLIEPMFSIVYVLGSKA